MFTASRLSGNCIGGYYDDDDEFVANTEGIIALCEGLKGSAVTSLECAATPQVFAFLSAPIDSPHHQPHSSARSLRSNDLGPKGAAALAEGLKGNTTLQSL